MIEWMIGKASEIDEDEVIYSGDDIKFEKIPLARGGLLVLNWNEDGLNLQFAVLRFYQSDLYGKNVLYQCLFHGCGPVGNLRECRHTYWGDGGYIFYLSGELIMDSFKKLSRYYDDLAV